MLHPLAFQMPGLGEWIVIGAIGLLLFGKRLPEVGRSLGKGIVEFKKGLKSVEEDVESAGKQPASSNALPADYKFDPHTGKPLTTQHKFDPYTGKPLDPQSDTQQTA